MSKVSSVDSSRRVHQRKEREVKIMLRHRARPIAALVAALLLSLGAQGATLARATLTVTDLEASLAFYRDLLGFRVAARMDYDTPALRRMFRIPPGATPTLVLLDGEGQPRALGLVAADGLAVDREANRSHAPALVVNTDAIAEVDRRLRAAGTPVVVPPTPLRAFDGRVIGTEAMYLDPDGVRIVLFDVAGGSPPEPELQSKE
jgi:catechol 2,3-dioxygenase-like lactoylglutathione lyase family enzyme